MTKAISPLGSIAAAGDAGSVKWTPTGVRILDPDLPYELWEELLFAAAALGRMSRWWVGDLINFGEGLYSERYSQALSLTGLAEGTLDNIASICRRVPLSRRREKLGISTHAVVAPLPPAEQDYWLREATANGWTREELRAAVDRARNGDPEVEVLPPASPLSAAAITTAAGSLATVREALEQAAATEAEAVRESGESRPLTIPQAVQALERASETLQVAASIPTLRDLCQALVAEATPYDPEDGGQTYYLVPAETIDELRTLVGEEAHG